MLDMQLKESKYRISAENVNKLSNFTLKMCGTRTSAGQTQYDSLS